MNSDQVGSTYLLCSKIMLNLASTIGQQILQSFYGNVKLGLSVFVMWFSKHIGTFVAENKQRYKNGKRSSTHHNKGKAEA